MADFSFDDATALMNNPMLYMGMTGMAPAAQTMNQYAGNVVRRGAIYGSMREPRPGAGRMPQPRGTLAPMPGAGAGYQFDPQAIGAANTALQSVDPRLSEPTQINPFLFFQAQHPDGSPTWAGHHPGMARAIEGAMIGATTPPGDSTGENISNVARTLLGMPGMYRQNAAAQMEAPFETAGQILGLRHSQAQIADEEAQTNYYKAHAAALGLKPTAAPHLYFNNDGEAISWDPNTGGFSKHPELNGSPKTARAGSDHYTEENYIEDLNAERQKSGQPPLTAAEKVNAVHTYYAQKAPPHAPRINPDLQFQVDQAQKDIQQWSQIYNENKPKDSVDAQIMQQADPERFKRYNEAATNLAAAQKRRDDLMAKHYQYSQQTSTSEDSDTPTADFPVRTGPGPALPPSATVTTNDGRPGQLVQTPNGPAIVPAQPGTTKKATAKSQPQKTAAQDPNNPLGLNF